MQSANVALAQSMETCGSTKAENDPVGPGKLPSRLPVAWMKTEKMCPLEGESSTKVLNAKAPDPHPEGSAVGEQVNSPPGINPTVPWRPNSRPVYTCVSLPLHELFGRVVLILERQRGGRLDGMTTATWTWLNPRLTTSR